LAVLASVWPLIDHPRSGVVYNFGPVGLYVCIGLSVCQTIILERLDVIFAHAVYPQVIRVMLVYEGHRVKVNVTEAKKVENSYSYSNFDRQ